MSATVKAVQAQARADASGIEANPARIDVPAASATPGFLATIDRSAWARPPSQP